MKTRTVLWWLVFVGFAINYMIRINLNITIVEMVSHKKPSHNNSTVIIKPACFNESKAVSMLSSTNKSILNMEIASSWKRFSLERQFLQKLNVSKMREIK